MLMKIRRGGVATLARKAFMDFSTSLPYVQIRTWLYTAVLRAEITQTKSYTKKKKTLKGGGD